MGRALGMFHTALPEPSLGIPGAPQGIWVWVTGEPWSWVLWDKKQPDNYANKQHFLAFSQEMNHRSPSWTTRKN